MDEGTSKSPEHNNSCNNGTLETKPTNPEHDSISVTSKEITTQRLDTSLSTNVSTNTIKTTSICEIDENSTFTNQPQTCLNSCISQKQLFFNQKKLTTQILKISSNLPSPVSVNIPFPTKPQPLFLLALSKLNENSLNLAIGSKSNISQLDYFNRKINAINHIQTESSELTPPGSLTSAPPSYSFVLRQMAVRRRPRLMGTFIPSPSFVQHTPPPNYATAFDIYVDNPIPPPPPRVYNFGFTPLPIVCPECGFTGMTMTTSKITVCTHLCALVLCLLCCWLCAPLPYMLKSCKDVYHYCRNCRNFLGMYCPTNPENAYS